MPRLRVEADSLRQVFGHPEDTSIGWNISPERQQLISSLMTLGGFFGAALTGPAASLMGRKAALWWASLLCCASNVVMMTTTDIGGLYGGRLLNGLSTAMFITFSQLYIQASGPAPSASYVLTKCRRQRRQDIGV